MLIFILTLGRKAGDSGSSCWALGRGAGIVDLHVGPCWALGGRLVWWVFMWKWKDGSGGCNGGVDGRMAG